MKNSTSVKTVWDTHINGLEESLQNEICDLELKGAEIIDVKFSMSLKICAALIIYREEALEETGAGGGLGISMKELA